MPKGEPGRYPHAQRDPAWGLAAVAAGISRAEQGLAMLRETLGDRRDLFEIEDRLKSAMARWRRLDKEIAERDHARS